MGRNITKMLQPRHSFTGIVLKASKRPKMRQLASKFSCGSAAAHVYFYATSRVA
jgi:hypothetical protein